MASLLSVLAELAQATEDMARMHIAKDPHTVPGLRCRWCGREPAHKGLCGPSCAWCERVDRKPPGWEASGR